MTTTPAPLSGFDSLIGFTVTEITAEQVVGTLPVRPDLHQPYGILHGGVYAAMVETAASIGGAVWFGDRGHVVGVSNTTNFLKATREGTLTAVATPLQRGRTQQLWNVAITDDTGRLVASGQVRLANITDPAQIGA